MLGESFPWRNAGENPGLSQNHRGCTALKQKLFLAFPHLFFLRFFLDLFSSFPASSSHCPQNRWATSQSTTPGFEDGILALLRNGNRSRCCRESLGLAPRCQLARAAIYCICAQTSTELIKRWLQSGRLVGRGGCLHTQQNQRWQIELDGCSPSPSRRISTQKDVEPRGASPPRAARAQCSFFYA